MDKDTALRRDQGARLKQARKAAGYIRSARAAALDNGWPESSYRAHEGGTRTIGLDDAKRYARRYRTLGAEVTGKSILYGNSEMPQPDLPVERVRPLTAPLLSWVAASRMADFGEVPNPSDAPKVSVADLPRGDWFALRVEGDSMDLVAPDGSIILINKADKRLIRNKFYVFGKRGEATFKRYVDKPVKRLEPFSTNRDHEPIYPQKDMIVIGRVHRVIVDL